MKHSLTLLLVLLLQPLTAPEGAGKPIPRGWFPVCYTMNGWVLQAPSADYAVSLEGLGPRESKAYAFRFELRKGDCWVAGQEKSFRSEINTDDYVSINSECWYGFSMMLPADFPIEDNRLVIGQWWSKPKVAEGEPYRSPPLAQRFRKGKFHITLRHSSKRVMMNDSDAEDTTLYETKQLALGSWHDFVYQVRWSNSSGLVNIWLDGKQVASYRGPVGYDDDLGPTFKFGIYRDDSKETYVVNFANVKRGKSMSEVEPSRPSSPDKSGPAAKK